MMMRKAQTDTVIEYLPVNLVFRINDFYLRSFEIMEERTKEFQSICQYILYLQPFYIRGMSLFSYFMRNPFKLLCLVTPLNNYAS